MYGKNQTESRQRYTDMYKIKLWYFVTHELEYKPDNLNSNATI